MAKITSAKTNKNRASPIPTSRPVVSSSKPNGRVGTNRACTFCEAKHLRCEYRDPQRTTEENWGGCKRCESLERLDQCIPRPDKEEKAVKRANSMRTKLLKSGLLTPETASGTSTPGASGSGSATPASLDEESLASPSFSPAPSSASPSTPNLALTPSPILPLVSTRALALTGGKATRRGSYPANGQSSIPFPALQPRAPRASRGRRGSVASAPSLSVPSASVSATSASFSGLLNTPSTPTPRPANYFPQTPTLLARDTPQAQAIRATESAKRLQNLDKESNAVAALAYAGVHPLAIVRTRADSNAHSSSEANADHDTTRGEKEAEGSQTIPPLRLDMGRVILPSASLQARESTQTMTPIASSSDGQSISGSARGLVVFPTIPDERAAPDLATGTSSSLGAPALIPKEEGHVPGRTPPRMRKSAIRLKSA